MLLKSISLKAILIVTIIVTACSILNKEDPDKSVREFLQAFGNSLTKTDAEILTQFETTQSRSTLLTAIRVLQNKDSKFIVSQLAVQQATITRGDKGNISAVIPVILETKDLEEAVKETTTITLSLATKDTSFVITKLEGEQFYQAYTSLKNSSEWSIERKEEFEKREPTYAMARAIETKFDTVIWYAVYNNKTYFYAVEGYWSNYFMEESNENYTPRDYRMGLLDSVGNIVIPFEYDLIGTLAFESPGLVEIKANEKFGYFDVNKRAVVVEPTYDMIIPYQKDSIWAIVKSDTTYGWLNSSFAYREGFPSNEVQQWVGSYKYLTKEVMLKHGNQVFCEIPNRENIGYGIIMPPSYFVKNNFFEPIVGGIKTTKVPMNGWTESVGAGKSIIQEIGDSFHALITVVEERYLGGREEFYGESKVVFVNKKSDIMGVTRVPTDQGIIITAIDTTLVEVEALSPGYWYNAPGNERDIPYYMYFRIREGFHLMPLATNRKYSFTEFVKIDSSYISGDFRKYIGYKEGDEEGEGEDIYEYQEFLSAATLQAIRNEILASYGMRFSDPSVVEDFSSSWYTPRYDTIDEFSDKITDIDRHNLAFLERVLALMKNNPV